MCSTIQSYCDAKLKEIDDRHAAVAAEIHTDSVSHTSSPAHLLLSHSPLPRAQIFCRSYALAQALICRSNERIRVAARTRDALNLLLLTMEIALDGDDGFRSGFAPALLHAVDIVRSVKIAQFALTPQLRGEGLWTVKML